MFSFKCGKNKNTMRGTVINVPHTWKLGSSHGRDYEDTVILDVMSHRLVGKYQY